MKFEVTILGSSSATPIFNRNPTSQILNVNEKLLMIDCGEGTQQQMLKYGIKYHKIDHIFISHLHGDHYFGLIGLISSMHLNGRTKPLYLFAPPQIKEILELQFKLSATVVKFEIVYFETQNKTPEVILETNDVVVETIVLNHRIPTTGFKFTEKQRLRKINKEIAQELNILPQEYALIKKGFDFTDSKGKVHKAEDLTTDADVPKSYAYCSDTLADGSYLSSLGNVDTLYHESTFMHEMHDRAQETFHTTSLQAATIAKEKGAKKLLIGHFSSRYKTLEALLDEAKFGFENTQLALEGKTFEI